MKMGTEVYRVLEKKIIDALGIRGPLPVSDRGAFVPDMEDDKDALSILNDSIRDAGYEGEIKIALDVAASVFYKEGRRKYFSVLLFSNKTFMITFVLELSIVHMILIYSRVHVTRIRELKKHFFHNVNECNEPLYMCTYMFELCIRET